MCKQHHDYLHSNSVRTIAIQNLPSSVFLTFFDASQYYAFFLLPGNIDPLFTPSDLEADFRIVLITFRRAMIFSATINIIAALISVLIFFFTSNAPSTNPTFIFLYHFSIYKDEIREEFYFSFQKIFLKKSKNLIFRRFMPVYFGRLKLFFSVRVGLLYQTSD
jgi:hypothetical protein